MGHCTSKPTPIVGDSNHHQKGQKLENKNTTVGVNSYTSSINGNNSVVQDSKPSTPLSTPSRGNIRNKKNQSNPRDEGDQNRRDSNSVIIPFPTEKHQESWNQIFKTYHSNIVDYKDTHSILDECICKTINKFKPAEMTLISRRVRKIIRTLSSPPTAVTSVAGTNTSSTVTALSSNTNGNITKTASVNNLSCLSSNSIVQGQQHSPSQSSSSWNPFTKSTTNGISNSKNNEVTTNDAFASANNHPKTVPTILPSYVKNEQDDNKSKSIHEKEALLDENIVRQIFLAGTQTLHIGVHNNIVERSLQDYISSRQSSQHPPRHGGGGGSDCIPIQKASKRGVVQNSSNKKTSNKSLTINYDDDDCPSDEEHMFDEEIMERKTNVKRFSSNSFLSNIAQPSSTLSSSTSHVADPIGAAYTLLLYLSESRWDYIATISKLSAQKAGFSVMDDTTPELISPETTTLLPPPLPIYPVTSTGLGIKRKSSSTNIIPPPPPPLPNGVSLQELAFIIALSLHSNNREQRLLLLFYLLLPKGQLQDLLKHHPNGGFPSWLLESIDCFHHNGAENDCSNRWFLSLGSLSHYYYYGHNSKDMSECVCKDLELKVNILTVIETIAILLHGNYRHSDITKTSSSSSDDESVDDEVEISDQRPSSKSDYSTSLLDRMKPDIFVGNRERMLSHADTKYQSAKMHVMISQYLRQVKHGNMIGPILFENEKEITQRLKYVEIFWDHSYNIYNQCKQSLNSTSSSTSHDCLWTLTDFMTWANAALSDDFVLDLVMYQLFGNGLLPSPSMERSVVAQHWIEWQNNFYNTNSSSSKWNIWNLSGYNCFSPTDDSTPVIDKIWGGIGGADGKGGVGTGILHCIDKNWWDQWVAYVGWEWSDDNENKLIQSIRKRPHELSNEILLDRDQESTIGGIFGSYEVMKPNLTKDIDYVLIPSSVWGILYELYGGGPPLPRMIIKDEHISMTSESFETMQNNIHKPKHLPKMLDIETHPWILDCQLCDPHQPYRRGDAGAVSVRIMVSPSQPIWRLFAEIVSRLPVLHPRGKDKFGNGRGRLWKKVDFQDIDNENSSPTNQYGPWALLVNSRHPFASFPTGSETDDSTHKLHEFKKSWQVYGNNETVESLGLNDGGMLIFEYGLFEKDGSITWPRKLAANESRTDESTTTPINIKIGNVVDAMDSSGRWFQAEIADIDYKKGKLESNNSSDNGVEGEIITVKIDFSDVGGHEEWINVNSDRLAIAGKLTEESMKSMDDIIDDCNTNVQGEPKSRSFILKRHSTNDESTFQLCRSLCSFPGFGACGLSNLGNTCYANAALQCISYMPILRSYIASSMYKKRGDLNKDNPLGTGGKLLEEFSDLLRVMWSAKYGYRSPTRFRSQLGKVRQQYAAADQQDAQELLNDMLDVLHEDANKVQSKPLVPPLEDSWVENTPLSRVGDEAWRRFLRRNRSMIVNTAMGQVHNCVTCPECNYVSRSFDPFNMLSIPFPTMSEIIVRCKFMKGTSSLNCKKLFGGTYSSNIGPSSDDAITEIFTFTIPRLAAIDHLKNRLSALCKTPLDRLKICIEEEDKIADESDKTYTLLTDLPDKDMPCLNLLQGAVRSELKITVFESTLRPRPHCYNVQSETDESSDESSIVSGSDEELNSIISAYGDEDECFIYDTDPVFVAKAISRKMWPLSSSDFRVGLRVDAIDQKNQWYRGTVIEVIKSHDEAAHECNANCKRMYGDSKEVLVKVHFDNFSAQWDMLYSIENFKDKTLLPIYTKTATRQAPLELHVHHRFGCHTNALFGQPFFITCYSDWSSARAFAQILFQTARFLEDSSNSSMPQEQVDETRTKIMQLIKVLIEADRLHVMSLISHMGENDESNKSRKLNDKVKKLLSEVPFQILVCKNTPPYSKEDGSDEALLDVSLIRTIGNYMNSKQTIVVEWSEYTTDTGSESETHVMYVSPTVHQDEKFIKADTHDDDNIDKEMHLGECLDEFCKIQRLENSECWRCPKCKDVREGKQGMSLWKLPDLLTFHLKRFNCSARWREKIMKKVIFPLTGLNMKKWCDKESPILNGSEDSFVYDLIGVVNHFGGMTGGHYTATCRATAMTADGSEEVEHIFNGSGVHTFSPVMGMSSEDENVTISSLLKLGRQKGKDTNTVHNKVALLNSKHVAESAEPLWLQFDDDLVEPVPPRKVVSETAYVLFYRRRRISPSNIAKYSTMT